MVIRTSTIWESASRPLFVKSVWIKGNGGLRHFILYNEHQENEEEQQQQGFRSKEPTGCTGVFKEHQQNKREIKSAVIQTKSSFETETISPITKLHEIKITNDDENLATRVLNWLELVGETKNLQKTVRTLKLNQTSENKFETNIIRNTKKRPQTVKRVSITFGQTILPLQTSTIVKNLTPRNHLKSAKQIKTSKNIIRSKTAGLKDVNTSNCPFVKKRRAKTANSNQKSFEMDYKSFIANQNFEDSNCIKEFKKQLHIFMPDLPKKSEGLGDCDSSCYSFQ